MSRRYPMAPASAFPRDRYGVREYSREAEQDYWEVREETERAEWEAEQRAAVRRLDLSRTAAALDAYDEAVGHAMALLVHGHGALSEVLDAEKAAGRSVVVAFAADTADRNSEADVLRFMSMDTPSDRLYVRRLVREWRATR